jgi:glycerol-3-phosphate acyltransferase PlsY
VAGVAFTLRYSSLAALCAALAAPAVAFVLGLDAYWVLACSAMSALLIWRHKDNIKRLVAGQESRIGSKKSATRPRRHQATPACGGVISCRLQRGRTAKRPSEASTCSPAIRRMAPAKAIIAPLSVHSSSSG